jgi:hypothetical protein
VARACQWELGWRRLGLFRVRATTTAAAHDAAGASAFEFGLARRAIVGPSVNTYEVGPSINFSGSAVDRRNELCDSPVNVRFDPYSYYSYSYSGVIAVAITVEGSHGT